MSDVGNVDAIRSAVAGLNRGDVDGYLQNFDPSCRRWIAGFEELLTLPAISDGFRQLSDAFDSLVLEEESLFGGDEQVCARWRLHGTHVNEYLGIAATGRPIDLRTCEVYVFRGSTVHTVWTYGDPMDLFRQIEAGSAGGGPS